MFNFLDFCRAVKKKYSFFSFLLSFNTPQVEFCLLIFFNILARQLFNFKETMSSNLILYMSVVTAHMAYFSTYVRSEIFQKKSPEIKGRL